MSEQPDLTMATNLDHARPTHVRMNGRFALLALANLALIGLAIRLAWLSGRAGAGGCGPEGGCSEVLGSIWGRWLGWPVSTLALAIYAGAFAGLLLHRLAPNARIRKAAGFVLACAATAMVGAALWFTSLMMWKLQQTCTQCLTLHALGLVFAVLVVLEFKASARRPDATVPGRAVMTGAVLLGCLSVALLAGGQVLLPSSSLSVEAVHDHDHDRDHDPSDASPMDARVYDSGPGPDRLIQPPIIDRTLRFADYPRLGPIDATHVVILFGDYACPHCHELSHQLVQAVDHYRGQLAVLRVMSPLNASCNPVLAGLPAQPRYAASCDLARLALAVNAIDPQAYEQFERWAAQSPTTPVLPEALEAALKLVSRDELTQRLSSPEINAALARHVDVFQAISPMKRTLPVLVMDNHYATGTPARPAELFALLEKQLGLQPPSEP